MQLGFIGTGEITSSIVTGLSLSGVPARSIQLSRRNSVIANELASRFPGIAVATATYATPGGINEQFLKDFGEHDLLTRVSQGLDGVLQGIRVKP